LDHTTQEALPVHDLFHRFAVRTSTAVGSPWAFAGALVAIGVWALIGPTVGFSNTWQLVINTGTTIVTFLIVFLIQNTQNRESRSIQLKLDELIIASTASDEAVDLENISDERAKELLRQFHQMAIRLAPK
jgi:low affinity Fe/Cu permease